MISRVWWNCRRDQRISRVGQDARRDADLDIAQDFHVPEALGSNGYVGVNRLPMAVEFFVIYFGFFGQEE